MSRQMALELVTLVSISCHEPSTTPLCGTCSTGSQNEDCDPGHCLRQGFCVSANDMPGCASKVPNNNLVHSAFMCLGSMVVQGIDKFFKGILDEVES
eukprot:5394361-Amphidinium_carterae.1